MLQKLILVCWLFLACVVSHAEQSANLGITVDEFKQRYDNAASKIALPYLPKLTVKEDGPLMFDATIMPNVSLTGIVDRETQKLTAIIQVAQPGTRQDAVNAMMVPLCVIRAIDATIKDKAIGSFFGKLTKQAKPEGGEVVAQLNHIEYRYIIGGLATGNGFRFSANPVQPSPN